MLIAGLQAGRSDWMDAPRPPADESGPAAAPAGAAPENPAAGPARLAAPDVAASGDAPAAQSAADAPPVPAPAGPAERIEPRNAADAAPAAGAPGVAPAPPAAPEAVVLSMAPGPAPSALPAPDPTVERRLLFLYYDDPRLDDRPQIGRQWAPALGPQASGAVRSARVEDVREVVEVAAWCTADEPIAALSDRIRLIEVRLEVEPAGLAAVEAELPVLAGAPPGLFHNRAPLLGGGPDAPLMEAARDFLGVLDDGDPEQRYFDSGPALARALDAAGCRRVDWNGGEGPSTGIGRGLARLLNG